MEDLLFESECSFERVGVGVKEAVTVFEKVRVFECVRLTELLSDISEERDDDLV